MKFFGTKNTHRLAAILQGLGFTEPDTLKHFMNMDPNDLFDSFREDHEDYKKLLISYNELLNEKYAHPTSNEEER